MKFELDLSLTPAQARVDKDQSRYQIFLAGRKTGKTYYAIYRCIRALGKRNAVVLYVGPTYRQAKMIAWRDFKRMIPADVIDSKNEADLTIDLKNGSTLYVMGSDQPDALRGITPDFVVLEEAAQHDQSVWEEIIRPALTAKQGRALFITTPKGYNWFYDLWNKSRGMKDWSRFHFTIFDNPTIPIAELEQAKKECRSDILWRQEYMAEFEAHGGRAIPGFSLDKHFIDLPPYRPGDFMIVPVDWGQRDDTAACFLRISNNRAEVLSYYGAAGIGARAQAQLIRRHWEQRKYGVDHAVLSHDAYRKDPDMKGDTVAWRFIDEFDPVPVERSDKLPLVRLDLLQTLAEQNKLLIQKSEETYDLAEQLIKLEWKDTMAMEFRGKQDGFDSLGYGVMNVSYRLGLDKERASGNTKSESRVEGVNYLRGYPKDERSPVFDEVTGYIGESVF